MQYKIPRLILYAGVIALASMCLFAIIDNYDLAINKGLSTTLSCYDSIAFDQTTGQTKDVRVCDTYNPQLIFFGSIVLLMFDAIIYHYFSKVLNARTEQQTRTFVNNLKSHQHYNGNNDNHHENNNRPKLVIGLIIIIIPTIIFGLINIH